MTVFAPRRTRLPWPFLPLALPASRSVPTFFSWATFDLSLDLREDFWGRFLVTLGMGAYLPCHGSPRKVFLARIRLFAPWHGAPSCVHVETGGRPASRSCRWGRDGPSE